MKRGFSLKKEFFSLDKNTAVVLSPHLIYIILYLFIKLNVTYQKKKKLISVYLGFSIK